MWLTDPTLLLKSFWKWGIVNCFVNNTACSPVYTKIKDTLLHYYITFWTQSPYLQCSPSSLTFQYKKEWGLSTNNWKLKISSNWSRGQGVVCALTLILMVAVLAIGMHFRRGLSILCHCPEFEQYFIRSQGARWCHSVLRVWNEEKNNNE